MLFSNLFSCGGNWHSIGDALGPSVFELKLQTRLRTAGISSTDHVLCVWRKERSRVSAKSYMGQRKGDLEAIPRQRGDNGQVGIDAKELFLCI